MARMHSRKHGKSGSKRPVRKGAPEWVKYKPEEVENLVLKLAKERKTQAQIGIALRDEYGIPSVRDITGKRVGEILEAHKLTAQIPEDMMSQMRQAVSVMTHMVNHKHDYKAKHGLELLESKIRRLAKYYKREGRLPKTWRYDPEATKLLVKS